jgi:serine/threonine protein kinase/ankyrin repeat protein
MNEKDSLWQIRGDELDERSSSRSEETCKRDPASPQDPIGTPCSSHTTVSTFSAFKYFGLSSEKKKLPCKQGDQDHDVFMGIQTHKEKMLVNNNDITPKTPLPLDQELTSTCIAALKCIESNDYGRLLKIAKSNPKILQCAIPKSSSKLQGLNGGTLLHVLVSQRLKLKKSKTWGSSHGSNTIHVYSRIPDSVVKTIIKMYPRALEMEDIDGRLPIHCACLTMSKYLEEAFNLYSKISWSTTSSARDQKSHSHIQQTNIVLLILRFNKRCVKVADKDGNLPIHYVAAMSLDYASDDTSCHTTVDSSRHHSKEFSARATMKKLLEVYPNSIRMANNKGMYPINMAASKGNKINKSCLELLLLQHQSLGEPPTQTDKNGDAPLYAAIKSGAPHDIIRLFAETKYGKSSHLFVQRDSENNNALHVALQSKYPKIELIRTILDLAPFTASSPDSQGFMPIRKAVQLRLDEDIICNMLSRDMPIEMGTQERKSGAVGVGKSWNLVGRCHHHSWWFILVSCRDFYLAMVYKFLSKEATHFQIICLARQVGPDGKSILIDCVSEKCRAMFQALLRFYDRYEILLSTNELRVNSEKIIDGVQTFLALDHGYMPPLSGLDFEHAINNVATHIKAVKVESNDQDDSEVEVSLLQHNKAKVLLRVYSFEQAFHAEIKVREMHTFDATLFEEVYNYHRHEHFSNLQLSKADKMHCIVFERPDHNLADVFCSVSRGPKTKQWNQKCCLVLKQIANALKSLHEQSLIHGHLEPENICKYGNQWKISQLGTVTITNTPMRGTFRSSAPPESIHISCSNVKVIMNGQKNFRRKSSKVKFSPGVLVSGKVRASQMNYGAESMSKQKVAGHDYCFVKAFSTWNSAKDCAPQKSQISPPANEDIKITFSPERVEASVAWDMWGFGLIMTQLLLGQCMHLTNFEKAEDAVIKKLYRYDNIVLQKICNQIDSTVGSRAADLVYLLLQKDPTKRPRSMEDVLEHQYFQELTVDI